MRTAYLFSIILFIGIISSRAQNTLPPSPRPLQQTHMTPMATVAGTDTVSNVPRSSAAANPPFVMSAPDVRKKQKTPKTGYEVGVWAGVNPVQDGNWKIGGANVDEGNKVWLGAGVKGGYTWPFSDEPVLQFQDEVGGDGLRLSGGLEGEAFYVGSRLRPEVAGVERKLDLESAVFMMNFLLKGQAGDFRPYLGPGFGAAAVFSNNYDVPGSTKSDDSDTVFAFQALGGCDYFVDRDWSVFGEYRFLLFSGVHLYDGPTDFRASELQQHIVAIGTRYHF